jgi:hypothetical protein
MTTKQVNATLCSQYILSYLLAASFVVINPAYFIGFSLLGWVLIHAATALSSLFCWLLVRWTDDDLFGPDASVTVNSCWSLVRSFHGQYSIRAFPNCVIYFTISSGRHMSSWLEERMY